MKKNTGTRLKPRVRTPEEQRKHRAEQAARAIRSPRLYPLTAERRSANWARIARCFVDFEDASKASAFVHRLGLATVPALLLDAAFPPEPEPAIEPPSEADQGALVALAEMPCDQPAEPASV